MNTDNTNDEIIIKEIDAWIFSVSKLKKCMYLDTVDYHPIKLEFSRQDVQELLNKMDKIIKSKK